MGSPWPVAAIPRRKRLTLPFFAIIFHMLSFVTSFGKRDGRLAYHSGLSSLLEEAEVQPLQACSSEKGARVQGRAELAVRPRGGGQVGQVTKIGNAKAREATNRSALRDVFEGAKSSERVSGLTHNFYRYPARFSPAFARAVILAFSQPGDTVFDPFMGGGTTLVEASVLGRKAVGIDINPLAVFVTKAKTTPLLESDLSGIAHWADELVPILNLHASPPRATHWEEDGYQRNISSRSSWPIRKTFQLALGQLKKLRTHHQRRFARCALLRTGQWALDCRATIPSASQFRRQFLEYLSEMIGGLRQFTAAIAGGRGSSLAGLNTTRLCLTRSAVGVETDPALATSFPPALILTSPPYPGVHVLYHRWQVQGRRETPAPFWVVGCPDGNGASYYTFGDRKRPGLAPYYDQLLRAYNSLARIADKRTVLVQLVAFSDPSWQLPKYLTILGKAGFVEIKFASIANSEDGRVWRSVPHRKWYAESRDRTLSSREVVVFHKPA